MNAKNIISAILMVLSFAACSSDIEGLDDNMTNTSANNGETSISVRMVTEGISTKAGNEGTTIDPTTEEAAIKNYIIAVFETKSGERVGYLKGSNNTNDIDATKSGVTGLTIGGIDCKAGIVNVLVIANLSEKDEAKFDAAYTYKDFTTQTVGSLINLVKVGSAMNQTLNAGDNKTVSIELSQITAGVEVSVNGTASVNGDSSGEGDVTATIKAISYKAKIESNSKLKINDKGQFMPEAGNGIMPENYTTLAANSFSFYTYRLNNPEMLLNLQIIVSAKGKDNKVIDKNISVDFKEGGSLVSILENGKKYQLNIEANVSVSVSCDVQLSYTLHKIEEIRQDINFN